MNIVKLIKEEIKKFLEEGVGDKYLANKYPGRFNDPIDKFEKQYQKDLKTSQPTDPNGEKVGMVGDDIPIYRNPKSLKNFDSNVRAVTDKEGNLYLYQINISAYHSIIAQVVNDYSPYYIGDAYDVRENVTWHRIKNTNKFGLSISYVTHFFRVKPIVTPNKVDVRYVIKDEDKDKVLQDVQKAKRKNPQFEFIPDYWEDIIKYNL